MNQIVQLFEAAFFAAAHPLSLEDLGRLAPDSSAEEHAAALEELRRHYEEHRHGVELVEVGDGFQLLTRRDLAETITEAQIVHRPRKLSRAALETLAVVAYRQPVSRADIEEIRGVSVEGVLRSLLDREMIAVVGRAEGLGRPLLYGTTPQLLELLGIRSLDELPRLEELSVALRPPTETAELGET